MTTPLQPTAPFPALSAVDPGLCPVCGQPNRCAMEQARLSGVAEAGPCWCTQVQFADSLLARVPSAAQGKACICAQCAAQAAAGEAEHAATPAAPP